MKKVQNKCVHIESTDMIWPYVAERICVNVVYMHLEFNRCCAIVQANLTIKAINGKGLESRVAMASLLVSSK